MILIMLFLLPQECLGWRMCKWIRCVWTASVSSPGTDRSVSMHRWPKLSSQGSETQKCCAVCKSFGFNDLSNLQCGLIIRRYRVSKTDYSWVTNLNLPKIRIEGIYTMKGRILILPLNGRGKCWLEPSKYSNSIIDRLSSWSKLDHTLAHLFQLTWPSQWGPRLAWCREIIWSFTMWRPLKWTTTSRDCDYGLTTCLRGFRHSVSAIEIVWVGWSSIFSIQENRGFYHRTHSPTLYIVGHLLMYFWSGIRGASALCLSWSVMSIIRGSIYNRLCHTVRLKIKISGQ